MIDAGSILVREALRAEFSDLTHQFLANGGRIEKIESVDVKPLPPRREGKCKPSEIKCSPRIRGRWQPREQLRAHRAHLAPQVRELAEKYCLTQIAKMVGVSRKRLERIALEHGIVFSPGRITSKSKLWQQSAEQ